MKRFFAVSLAVLMLLSLFACSKKASDKDYKEETISSSIKDDDGIELISIECAYPVFSGKNVTALNTAIRESVKGECSEAESRKEDAQLQRNEDQNFMFYMLSCSYTITYNKNDMVSVVLDYVSNYGGAHPSEYYECFNYSIASGEPLELTDIFNLDGEQAKQLAINTFKSRIEQNPDNFFEDASETLQSDDFVFAYNITDDAIQFTAGEELLAPHAAGPIQTSIPFAGNENVFQSVFTK